MLKVSEITSAIDDMLMNMAVKGYVQPVAQSEVAKTLDGIRKTGKLDEAEYMPSLKVTCAIPKVTKADVAEASKEPGPTPGPSRKKC